MELILRFSDMTKPEQELLAKYLLQQLISRDPDPELDPVLARLARADLAAGLGGDLASEQSQTIATIVPAPPGLETGGAEARSEDTDQCECQGEIGMEYKHKPDRFTYILLYMPGRFREYGTQSRKSRNNCLSPHSRQAIDY